ncbi:hypothetical protein [Tahibacter harae]|uniref:Uncharacterized protein n=1 Tax=Tahibacter harae TaxID=2963937 RepID=A0ABT1QR87_9GAMM|nr:hypothetical protein [Tahibacter harae]MCQ4164821.1 hypothetical protein [Tahibacter harae]
MSRLTVSASLAVLPLVLAAMNSQAAMPLLGSGPPQPDVVLPWADGVPNFNIASNVNCITGQIETRVSGYTGYSLLPPNLTPAVGEVFYTHLVLGHPGNPCTGSAVGIELSLPPGVQTAVSANDPTFCFSRSQTNLFNLGTDPEYGCPTTFPNSANGLRIAPPHGGLGGSGGWGMHQGFWLELLIPLRATTPQLGTNQIVWTINPDIGQFGQVRVGPQVNNIIIFRDDTEGKLLQLTICTVQPIPQGC